MVTSTRVEVNKKNDVSENKIIENLEFGARFDSLKPLAITNHTLKFLFLFFFSKKGCIYYFKLKCMETYKL